MIIHWLDFGDHPVASFRRSRSGSIAPINNTGVDGKPVGGVDAGAAKFDLTLSLVKIQKRYGELEYDEIV
ncbi:MAG: hypothetical protein MZV70_07255 [Desulfobacterales bacterium]|nr:hypothetical protein [Desulfobacterales bacterium]